jgi:hypothetical protein
MRDDASAAKETAKQAKRSAFKVPVNNASAIHPSALSALHIPSFPPGGLWTSSYASSPPGMNVWPQQQHQSTSTSSSTRRQ